MTLLEKKTSIRRSIMIGTAAFVLSLSGTGHAFPYHAAHINPGIPSLSVVTVSTEDVGMGAQKFIDGMAQRALDFLANTTLSQEQKTNEFRKLLQDSFDLETIGRFALGRYWRTATPEQRKEYQKLFREMVVQVYSERFKGYEGQHMETRSYRIDGDNDTIVTSFIVPKDDAEIQVDWRVRYKNGRYQIVDVIVEGVSMSVTQRSDFSSTIQRGGGDIEVLFAHLKQ